MQKVNESIEFLKYNCKREYGFTQTFIDHLNNVLGDLGRSKELLHNLYEAGNKLDLTYLDVIRHGTKNGFTGEEYDEINDVFCDVEDYLEL